MRNKIRVLVVGCGHMGASHARAYHRMKEDFEIVGLVSRGASRAALNGALGGGYREFTDFRAALAATRPAAVCLSTFPETHAEYALAAMEAGADLFVEKPIAENLADGERIKAAALRLGRKVVVGYILNVHPSWARFVQEARGLGKPLVMRMNLNQQSSGANWGTHRRILASLSPLVDCGVHYVDVMCRMTQSRPVRVSAIGARLSDEIAADQVNYGQLQVTFADGSVGWYEAGWGPMMSETAFFLKDVVGPKGCVSMVPQAAAAAGNSANVSLHTKSETLRVHSARLDPEGAFAEPDRVIDMADEPDHDRLCQREQEELLRAIREGQDTAAVLESALDSLRIVLAADRSLREGRTIAL